MALFDDAERFESCIVIGDTVRHTKDRTKEHVGPGTYSPSLYDSKEFGFGHRGVSISRRSKMDPPTSPKSSEYQRFANGYVLRNGVLFHGSPFLSTSPGPGSYSPPTIPIAVVRGVTAKPSSGQTGRQAWDLRGTEGGVSNVCLRDGHTISSAMGDSPRMSDFSRVALRGDVLFLRGAEDGHRTNGIGPGTYEGPNSRQDSMMKRSHNVRAHISQVRRERSLSFSGTSSGAKAHLSLQSPRTLQNAADGRPDLHLLARRMPPAGSTGGPTRSISPASAMLTSMRARAAADAALDRMSSRRARARSVSPKRTTTAPSPMALLFPSPSCYTWGGDKHRPTVSVGHSMVRGCRSLSPSPTEKRSSGGGITKHDGRAQQRSFTSAEARKAMRATSLSPRVHKAHQWEPSYPQGGHRVIIGTPAKAADAPTGNFESFGFDCFGPAGQNEAWQGPEVVSPAKSPVAAMEKENTGLYERGNIPPLKPPPPPLREKGKAEGGCDAHQDAVEDLT